LHERSEIMVDKYNKGMQPVSHVVSVQDQHSSRADTTRDDYAHTFQLPIPRRYKRHSSRAQPPSTRHLATRAANQIYWLELAPPYVRRLAGRTGRMAANLW
jgi:hypothetical protein